eukprot:TRINITY_DN2517_c0_g7_i2.p1 TRINITY_DN2517_c0_g7~~TRINITY_DN2517_c0_g7_i2.p1  ORF type:complete len:166 (-),score=3.06 TRINITY_DN2517_c0_g7_i2:42-539(-)
MNARLQRNYQALTPRALCLTYGGVSARSTISLLKDCSPRGMPLGLNSLTSRSNTITPFADALNRSKDEWGGDYVNTNELSIVRNIKEVTHRRPKLRLALKFPSTKFASAKIIRPLLNTTYSKAIKRHTITEPRTVKERVRPGLLLDKVYNWSKFKAANNKRKLNC